MTFIKDNFRSLKIVQGVFQHVSRCLIYKVHTASPRGGQPVYYTKLSSRCQELFSFIRRLFSPGFRDSLLILPLLLCFVKHYFSLFLSFFHSAVECFAVRIPLYIIKCIPSPVRDLAAYCIFAQQNGVLSASLRFFCELLQFFQKKN